MITARKSDCWRGVGRQLYRSLPVRAESDSLLSYLQDVSILSTLFVKPFSRGSIPSIIVCGIKSISAFKSRLLFISETAPSKSWSTQRSGEEHLAPVLEFVLLLWIWIKAVRP